MCIESNINLIHDKIANRQICIPEGRIELDKTVYSILCDKKCINEAIMFFYNIFNDKNLKFDNYSKVKNGVLREIISVNIKNVYKKDILSFLLNNKSFELPVGNYNEINICNIDMIQKFHQKWYTPNNSSIVLVGDIEVEIIEKMVQDIFSKINQKKY